MNIYNFIYDKQFWLLRHLPFWMMMYLDEFLSFFGVTDAIEYKWLFLIGILVDLFMVYFNFYVLIPQFYQKEKFQTYFFLTVLTLLVNITISNALGLVGGTCEDCGYTFYEFFTTALFTTGLLGIALVIKISKINYLEHKRLTKLQAIQHETELNYLKKQANPHFLFNVLNSIYVISRETPKEVPEVILKLSDLMRYQTYEATKKTVRLNQEIEFIKQYLELEKIRRENLQTNIVLEGDMNNIAVPPLLFLPFIENACKHSQLANGEPEHIEIKWEQSKKRLIFVIENTIGRRDGLMNDQEYSGFGLDNIKKRIQLLYPNKHQLQFIEEAELYKVELIIEDIKRP